MTKFQKVLASGGYIAAFVLALIMFVQSYIAEHPAPTAPADSTVTVEPAK